MKTRYFFASAALWGIAAIALAQTPFDITYPIPELGNCASGAECKVYCDDLSHKDACLSFAERYGFAKKEDVEKAKRLPSVGPGGCTSQEQCKAYCNDSANHEECVAFAEKNGISVNKGAEVRERAKLIREEGGPGKCQSDGECRAYCENPANHGECLDFAEKKGLMSKDDLARARKFAGKPGPGGCVGEACRTYCDDPNNLKACIEFAEQNGFIDSAEAERIKRLPPVGPGGCRGEACKTYCDDPAHQEECFSFAEKNGLMSKDELERARKFAGKPGPGGCRGEACRTYCQDPKRAEECIAFAVENNLIPKEEAERARKFARVAEQGGPGGCRGEACRDFCENPANQEQCFEFAKQNGLISEAELKMAERGRELSKKVHEAGGPGGCKSDQECQAFCRNPDNVEACLAFAVEHGGINKEEAEGMLRKFIDGVKDVRREGFGGPDDEFENFENERFQKFEQFRALEGQYRKPGMMQGEFPGGPGGCKGPEECIKYCSDPEHRQECGIFGGDSQGMGAPGFGGSMGGPGMTQGGAMMAGPGGCKGPEECVKYCSNPANREECAKFNPSQGAPPPGEMFRQAEPGDEGMFRREGFQGQPPMGQTTSGACAGPKPGIPTPMGCTGPVCKDGRWGFDCPQGDRMMPPESGMMPKEGMEQPMPSGTTQIREGVSCPQEWHPVCGTNGRTYPNLCFAKVDNATVAKEGSCEGTPGTSPTQPNTYPQPYPSGTEYQKYPDGQYPQPYPSGTESPTYPDGQYPQPYPSGSEAPKNPDEQYSQQYPSGTGSQTYPEGQYPTSGDYQQPPSGTTTPPPTSLRKKSVWDYFLSNLLQGFTGGLRTR